MSNDVKKVTSTLKEKIDNISKLADETQAAVSKEFDDTAESLNMTKDFAKQVGDSGRALRDPTS